MQESDQTKPGESVSPGNTESGGPQESSKVSSSQLKAIPSKESEIYRVVKLAAAEFSATEESEVEKVFDLTIQSDLYVNIRSLAIFTLCDRNMLNRNKQKIAEEFGYASATNFYATCSRINKRIQEPNWSQLKDRVQHMREKLGIKDGEASSDKSLVQHGSSVNALVALGTSIPEHMRDGLSFYVLFGFPGVTPEDVALAYGVQTSYVQEKFVQTLMYLRDRERDTGDGVIHLLNKIKVLVKPL